MTVNSYEDGAGESPNTYNNPAFALKHSKLTQTHERSLLVENNRHELDVLDKKHKHEQLIKDKDLGWLGHFFGGRELTALNISGLLLIFLVLFAVIFSLVLLYKESKLDSIVTLWGIFTPLITLTLGYVFGSKNSSSA